MSKQPTLQIQDSAQFRLVKYLPSVFIFLLLTGSSFTSGWFTSPTLWSYYFYILSCSLITIFAVLLFFWKKTSFFRLTKIDITALLFIAYVLSNCLLTNNYINPRGIYLIGNILFFIAIKTFLSAESLRRSLFIAVMAYSMLESLVCILQSLHLVDSNNGYFPVTGLSSNPNITGMSLAMAVAIPTYLLLVHTISKGQRLVVIVVIVISISAMILLKCRTAILGTGITILIIGIQKYNPLSWFGNRKKILTLTFAFVVGLVMVVAGSFYAYQAKKASADGRLLIWKISTKAILDHPIIGIGYGNFEHDYNLYQSQYFSSLNNSQTEANNASHTRTAYSEIIENLMEGGIICVGFIAVFLYLLLFECYSTRKQIPFCSAAIACFILMSTVNFTVQAIPVMVLFLLYGAIVDLEFKQMISVVNLKPDTKKSTTIQAQRFFNFTLLIVSLFIFYNQLNSAKANAQLKRAQLLYKKRNYSDAENILTKNQQHLKHSAGYWEYMGRIFYMRQDYEQALNHFNQVQRLSSGPDVFLETGYALEKLGRLKEAISTFQIAAYIQPNLLRPWYATMTVYLKLKDSSKAKDVARHILFISPKRETKETLAIRNAATYVLKQ